MKILFLTQDRAGASTRYRVLQYLPFLEKEGFEVRVVPVPRELRSRFHVFRRLREYDLVFLQRRLFQPWEFAFLRRGSKKLIFDFDDAVMYRDPSRSRMVSVVRGIKFRTAVSACDGVIAGNDYLASKARRFNSCVLVLPTVVDLKQYPEDPPRRPAERITLGWIGSASTLFYLRAIRGSLARLGEGHRGPNLLVVGEGGVKPGEFGGLEVVEKVWREEEEVANLLQMDIGLAPLKDDPWSQGKCGLKVLQYFAAARPVVASPVGVQKDMVQDGRNGFLARGEEEWAEKVTRLMEDEELRFSMGREARLTVERDFSLGMAAPRLRNFLLEVLSKA